jgi:hypothetical protein
MEVEMEVENNMQAGPQVGVANFLSRVIYEDIYDDSL